MWIAVAGIAGALLGALLSLQLRTLHYRRPDEQHLPQPRPTWWLTPTTGLTWAWLTWHLTNTTCTALALWLPLSAALGWLSAVDLDVRRLPNTIVIPAAGWVAAILTTHAITTKNPAQAMIAAAIGAACGLGAWILHHASRGALGFGDVKLVAILATALALIQPRLVLPALLTSCLAAIVIAVLTRRREFEFGPSLAIGCILAIGLTPTL